MGHIPKAHAPKDQSRVCWADGLRVRQTMCVCALTPAVTLLGCLVSVGVSLPPHDTTCRKKRHTHVHPCMRSHAGHIYRCHGGHMLLRCRCRSVQSVCSMPLLAVDMLMWLVQPWVLPLEPSRFWLPSVCVLLGAGYSSTHGDTSTGAGHSGADLLRGPGQSHVSGTTQGCPGLHKLVQIRSMVRSTVHLTPLQLSTYVWQM